MDPSTEQVPEFKPRRARAWPAVLFTFLVLAGGGGYMLWRVYNEPHAVKEPLSATDGGPGLDAGEGLAIADGDALLKKLAADWSKEADYLKWLEVMDLRRLVAATQNVAEGDSPRASLPFLAITGPFPVREVAGPKAKPVKVTRKKGAPPAPPPPAGKVFLAPEGYARYDSLARVFGSINAASAGDAWAQLEPFANVAFGEIGKPGKQFHDVLTLAIRRMLSVHLMDGEIELEPKGAVYLFKDPAIESLSAAEKHLLRMGPGNARVVQAQLRTFAEHAKLDVAQP